MLVPRDVEHHSLEEQEEAHPLVVLVVLDVVTLVPVPDARVGHVPALLPRQPVGYGVRAVDPAVGVHDRGGHGRVDYAVDRVADVRLAGDEEREGDEDYHGRLVVEPKHRVVYADFVEFEEPLERAEDYNHF